MNDIDIAVLLSRWIHIGAVIVAIGGAVYQRFALLPGAQEALDDDARDSLREALRRRWSKVVGASIGVLLLTGFLNFVLVAVPPKIHAIPYHPIFGLKLLMAFAIFFLASVLAGRSPGFAAMRKNSAKWLNVIIALAVVIVFLSGLMSQIRQHQTPPEPPVTSVEAP